jgi:hypothetical protein
MNTVLKLLCLHTFLYPLEWCFKKQGILRYPGDFTNKIISTICVIQVIRLPLISVSPIQFLMEYFVYDLIYICTSLNRIKHHYIFIIHHFFTALVCYIGHDQGFGNEVFVIFELPSPILHITKIVQAICPKYQEPFKKITKNSYYLFRVLTPPFWIFYKLATHYNQSFKHILILSGIIALWQASIAWYRKML